MLLLIRPLDWCCDVLPPRVRVSARACSCKRTSRRRHYRAHILARVSPPVSASSCCVPISLQSSVSFVAVSSIESLYNRERTLTAVYTCLHDEQSGSKLLVATIGPKSLCPSAQGLSRGPSRPFINLLSGDLEERSSRLCKIDFDSIQSSTVEEGMTLPIDFSSCAGRPLDLTFRAPRSPAAPFCHGKVPAIPVNLRIVCIQAVRSFIVHRRTRRSFVRSSPSFRQTRTELAKLRAWIRPRRFNVLRQRASPQTFHSLGSSLAAKATLARLDVTCRRF